MLKRFCEICGKDATMNDYKIIEIEDEEIEICKECNTDLKKIIANLKVEHKQK